VQNDFLHRIEESRNLLDADIRKLLQRTTQIADEALARAKIAQQVGAEVVKARYH